MITSWLERVTALNLPWSDFAFWRLRGQSLGMQVWQIRTFNESDEIPTPHVVLSALAFMASLACVGRPV